MIGTCFHNNNLKANIDSQHTCEKKHILFEFETNTIIIICLFLNCILFTFIEMYYT